MCFYWVVGWFGYVVDYVDWCCLGVVMFSLLLLVEILLVLLIFNCFVFDIGIVFVVWMSDVYFLQFCFVVIMVISWILYCIMWKMIMLGCFSVFCCLLIGCVLMVFLVQVFVCVDQDLVVMCWVIFIFRNGVVLVLCGGLWMIGVWIWVLDVVICLSVVCQVWMVCCEVVGIFVGDE